MKELRITAGAHGFLTRCLQPLVFRTVSPRRFADQDLGKDQDEHREARAAEPSLSLLLSYSCFFLHTFLVLDPASG